jgi:hypothetical protein
MMQLLISNNHVIAAVVIFHANKKHKGGKNAIANSKFLCIFS